jgi:5-methylcytosine-specific restriction endonuclease McrA
MIHIEKSEKPDVLKQNENTWTTEYLEALEQTTPIPDRIRYRYRHPNIKLSLVNEVYGKCIYCERKVAFGETDHIYPVSRRPELIVTWDNLGLVCKECNMYKGDYYDEAEPLLNPFSDDPLEHLAFYGPMILSKAGHQEGFRTIEALKLQRTEVFERRKERIERLQALIEQWSSLPEGSTKELAKNKILEEAENDKEFSAVVKAFLYQSLGWAE